MGFICLLNTLYFHDYLLTLEKNSLMALYSVSLSFEYSVAFWDYESLEFRDERLTDTTWLLISVVIKEKEGLKTSLLLRSV